jgi:drug/metabolite transporter (DMT)-like permease
MRCFERAPAMSEAAARAWPGATLALASAALFGAGTPFAKLLLDQADPWLLAGLLYLGSGLGLGAWLALRRIAGQVSSEAPMRQRDWPFLFGIVLLGGGIAPVLLMIGLATTDAAAASLLLNLETILTLAIAWLFLRENVDLKIAIGAAAILGGAILLSLPSDGGGGVGWGALAVAGACLAWAIDNALSRRLAATDPLPIAALKGLAAGGVNLALALLQGRAWPGVPLALGAGAIGLISYGASLVLFLRALRLLGMARSTAYFSLAPFIGAALAVLLLAEPITVRLCGAALLMGVGLALHLTERHEHVHEHAPLAHEHSHIHDEHHRHAHEADPAPDEPHTHPHRHARLLHRHPHYPDLHHRHRH